MFISVLKSKIHRARVTEADLEYIGSIGIDQDYMDRVGIMPNEKVLIVNNNNGERWETYVIAAERGSKAFAVNGAAARLCQVGDVLVIMAFAMCSPEETPRPRVLVLDQDNNPRDIEAR